MQMMGHYTRIPDGNVQHGVTDGEREDVCSYIRYTENVTDTQTNKVSVRVDIKDHQGFHKTILVPRAFTIGNPSRLIEFLLNAGFVIFNQKLAKAFLSELSEFEPPENNIDSVSSPGWHAIPNGSGNAFVTNNKTFTPSGAECNIELDGTASTVCSSKGTLSEWKEHVAKLCDGNSRLMLMLSTSFSGPLLYIIGHHNSGLHIHGPSRAGKTTGLVVASSVYGGSNFRSSWNATSNALQETVLSYNDTVLPLDELAQCDPKQLSLALYDIGNGLTKGRLNSDIKLNAGTRFRVMVISNGEDSIQEHLQQGGIDIKAGQTIRLISIPVHSQYGLFEDIHSFDSSGEFASALLKNADTYYGSAGRVFLRRIVDNQDELRKVLPGQVQEIEKALLACLSTDNPTALQRSVAKSMAVIACAGELAIKYKILPWAKGRAIAAAKKCFKAWNRYEQEAELERNPAFGVLKQFFHDNEPSLLPLSRYVATSELPVYTHDVDGNPAFLVSPEYFERTLCRQFGKKSGLDALKKHGLLVPNSRGGPTRQATIPKKPELGKPGFYVIRATILTSE
jgi:putative DNA primase/helicase